jgi:RNA polymerase sigma-70 factor (ECF subfamily)
MPTEEAEAGLVVRAAEGDEAAFGSLVEAHKDMVYNLAFKILGNAQDAEDAFQETFISAYKNISKFRGDSKVSTWLYRIALNRSRDMLASRRTRGEMGSIHEEGFDVPSSATVGGADSIVQDALRFLSEDYRTAITLHCLMGYSYDEAGDIMGIPGGTVKTYVFRGKDELRKVLKAAE